MTGLRHEKKERTGVQSGGEVSPEYALRLDQLASWSSLDTRTVRTDRLKVGDIIKVRDDEVIPADCFILASGSSLESQSGG